MKSLLISVLLLGSNFEDKGTEVMSAMEYKCIEWSEVNGVKRFHGEVSWTAVNDGKVQYISPKLANHLLAEEIDQTHVGYCKEKKINVRKFHSRKFGWYYFVDKSLLAENFRWLIKLSGDAHSR